MATSMNSIKMSAGEREVQSAYYIAESGATVRMAEIEELANSLSDSALIKNETDFFSALEDQILSPIKIENFESHLGRPVRANVTVTSGEAAPNNKTRAYKIISEGEIGDTGKKSRTVEGSFVISYNSGSQISLPNTLSVFTNNKINLSNGTIEGDLILNNYSNKGIEISGDPTVNGRIIVPVNSNNNVFHAPDWWIRDKGPQLLKIHQKTEFALPSFPEQFPKGFAKMPNKTVGQHPVIHQNNINITNSVVNGYKIDLDKNYEFNDITFTGNRKLTFVVNEDREIVVNKINGNGELLIEGKGKLTMYLKDNIHLENNLNPGNINNLFIYIGPSNSPNNPKTIKSSQYADFNASIYAIDANVEIVGSGEINGHIVTGGKSVKLSGGTKAAAKGTVVYAPFADVELTGSGTLKGGVVSKTFAMHGGAKVIGDSVNLSEIPFFGGNVPGGSESGFEKGILKEASN